MPASRFFLCSSCNRNRRSGLEGEMRCYRCVDDQDRVRRVAALAVRILPQLKGRHPSYIFARMLRGVVERMGEDGLGSEVKGLVEELKQIETRELKRGWEYAPSEGERP